LNHRLTDTADNPENTTGYSLLPAGKIRRGTRIFGGPGPARGEHRDSRGKKQLVWLTHFRFNLQAMPF
jgi:hypothetical protein